MLVSTCNHPHVSSHGRVEARKLRRPASPLLPGLPLTPVAPHDLFSTTPAFLSSAPLIPLHPRFHFLLLYHPGSSPPCPLPAFHPSSSPTWLPSSSSIFLQISWVRMSSHTMALWMGCPVVRDHTTVCSTATQCANLTHPLVLQCSRV